LGSFTILICEMADWFVREEEEGDLITNASVGFRLSPSVSVVDGE
jgi:hypothetical protein